ncbi:hypothetical protein FA95DRAFT_942368 [Auriscalpium vulgare]|uniref:Uncharacterized protein n=1 Tax=Auriscalpium vulgare TaxID=40419 RepID=A0ACB8SBD0_9AGAM|nr:hypothetical protein FA95DRAFT_942368 [Auriscalpium vulgare]
MSRIKLDVVCCRESRQRKADDRAHCTPAVHRMRPGSDEVLPQLIGRLLNSFLYGILFVQVCVYCLYFAKDRRHIKFLVFAVFIMETVQTALAGCDLYYWLCKNFGNYEALDDGHLSMIDTPIIGSITALVVQCLFSYRIQAIKKSLLWLSVVIFLLSMLQAAGAIIAGSMNIHHSVEATDHKTRILDYIWGASSAAADTTIALTMVYLFLSSRHSEFHYMKDVLTRLMYHTVDTNLLSASVIIISLALFLGAPSRRYYFVPAAIISKVYANTLLISLNNRIHLRDVMGHHSNSQTLSRQLPGTLLRNLDHTLDVASRSVSDDLGLSSISLQEIQPSMSTDTHTSTATFANFEVRSCMLVTVPR